MQSDSHEVSISSKALIHQHGRFLLQHRDNFPHIWHPDHWGLFGGEIESWETPAQGLLRELAEELNWQAKDPTYLLPWYPRPQTTIHIFGVDLDVPVANLELTEGAGMAMFSLDEMRSLKLTPEISQNFDAFTNHYEDRT